MGHKGAIIKAQRNAATRERQRHQRSGKKTAARNAAPAVKRVDEARKAPRPFPTAAQQAMLARQPWEAAQLATSAIDLCRVLTPANGEATAVGAKRGRDEVIDTLTPATVFEGLREKFAALIVDEYGVRVVSQLIRAAANEGADEGSLVEQIVDTVMACVDAAASGAEEGKLLAEQGVTDFVGLATHSIGRAVVWVAIEHGTKAQRKRLNRELAAYALTLAVHRHGVHTITALMQHYPKSKKTLVPALVPIIKSQLLNDPIGATVAMALVAPDTAVEIVEAITTSDDAIANMGADKRGQRFLAQLLSEGFPEGATEAGLDAAVQTIFAALEPSLLPLAKHSRGNFVVQGLIKAAAHVAPAVLDRVVKAFTSNSEMTLVDLAGHHHAAHVVGCLAAHASKPVAAALRPDVLKLATNKHGSLALRRVLEGAGANASAVAEALLRAMSQHVESMIRHEHANFVVQAIVKALTVKDRADFVAKHIRPRIVELAQDAGAAHVVFAVLGDGVLDAASATQLSGALKSSLVDLAMHVNGRFVVERIIASQRDAQQTLVDNIERLVYAKGAHHVVVRLYEVCAPAVRAQLAKYVASHLGDVARDQNGSLTVQKLIASDKAPQSSTGGAVLAAVRAALGFGGKNHGGNGLAQALRSDFFGRFVVQQADGAAPAKK